MRTSMKLSVLGMTAAAALVTTACDPSGSDGKADDAASPAPSASTSASTSDSLSPSVPASTPSKPALDKTASPSPTRAGSSGDDKNDKNDKWDLADRQTPPTGSVCDHDGQGPYGAIKSVTMGGESPTGLGLVLGFYQCDGGSPRFTPSSATGAATDVLVDPAHLKVVVGGQLASELGTKTPDTSKFFDKLAQMEDKNELKGPKAPQFYFRIDSASDDVNEMPDDSSHIIYLYQIVDGG
ncbi:hypothetical protein NGF19_12650 [Streptomyces sp. RY43-2]|uniref:Lipoprotein n=1 Tax=Streptomyces macrolidinus TaxID=2952607 RepID=A0ABT0ZDJ1_9ACTN|nr:hypothetical protein [Streptomyces macrolidinus]MCN9241632.1 hypothetical protein [Streptomyces macrolidinus]